MNEFSITEQSLVNQFPAVGASVIAPKGLGTGGYKPLMRNHRAQVIKRRRDRNTAGNTLPSEQPRDWQPQYMFVFSNQWRGLVGKLI